MHNINILYKALYIHYFTCFQQQMKEKWYKDLHYTFIEKEWSNCNGDFFQFNFILCQKQVISQQQGTPIWANMLNIINKIGFSREIATI